MPRGAIAKRSSRTVPGGGGPGVATPLLAFPNVATMAAYDTTLFVDGAIAEVQTLAGTFLLDKTSALAVTPTTVVNATGGGQWLRQDEPSLRWQNQQLWFIAFTTGNDEGDGSAFFPIKTWHEMKIRMGEGPLLPTAVTFTENSPENVVYDFTAPGTVEIVGLSSTTFTGTVSGAVNANGATSTHAQITAAALPVSWTASGLVGKIGVLTSGASNGRTFVVSADLAAKTARITQPAGAIPILSYPIANGDTFDMQLLVRLTGIWHIASLPSLLFGGFLELNNWTVSSGDPLFVACEVLTPTADGSGRARFVSSRVDNAVVRESAELYVFSCSMIGSVSLAGVSVGPLGSFTAEENLFEGGNVAGTTGILGDELTTIRILTYVGIYDTDDAIRVGSAARIDASQAYAFGTSNALVGIQLGARSTYVYSVGFIPNILTPAVQVQLGNRATTYAQLPYTNPIDQAAVVADNAASAVEDSAFDLAADVTIGAGTTADLLSTGATINVNGTRQVQIWVAFAVTEGASGQGFAFLQVDGATVRSCELGAGVVAVGAAVQKGALIWQGAIAEAGNPHTIRVRGQAITATIFCRGSTQRAIENCSFIVKGLYG